MILNWIDYIMVGVVGLSVMTGLFRGFVKELIAICIWVLAIWLGMTYGELLTPWVKPYFDNKTACFAAGFILILLATLFAGAIVNGIFSFILHRSGLSGTDRLLGMGFGFVRGVFIVALALFVINMTSLSKEPALMRAHFYPYFKPVVTWMEGFMPTVLKKVGFFDTVPHESNELSLLRGL
ncbi:MAG: CvpA family protein [Legionellaceae bacterium]